MRPMQDKERRMLEKKTDTGGFTGRAKQGRRGQAIRSNDSVG